jgi:hypothetical protein
VSHLSYYTQVKVHSTKRYGLTTIASQAGWFDDLLIPLLAATTFVTDVLIAAFLYYCLCSDKSDWAS